MPPRRSSRSTRASIEPAQQETLPSKRKRGQTVELATDETEISQKPPSRARRPSSRAGSAPTSKSRTSARGKPSLPDVAESQAEESDAQPVRKRSRPSDEGLRSGDSVGNQEQEDVKPVIRKASQPPKRQAGRTGSKARTSDAEASAAATSDDSEEEPKIKTKRRKATSRNISGKGRKVKRESVPEQSEEHALSESKNRQDSDMDDDIPDFKPKPSPRKPRQSTREPVDEEEEEKSLFEPPPIPPPQSTAPPPPEEPSGPKSRLMIHKLALVNFKSYAGRQVIGPFHKSFSAIVGPNGSGKSNTIDALLFVFGYRASKMRQSKLSELIHNSDKYPNLDECSVEVHFREILDLPGPDAFEVVQGTDLVVARQAFKNNSSKYTINGRSSSYTEVQTLLKGRGIDLDHKRFLILQGEVESIAQMKPKAASEHEDGLLEYLEDIIGTSKYKEPIDEALVDMERLQEERSVKMNRLRIVEKDKAALEDQKREAEDYLRLKNDCVRAASRLYQFYIWKSLIVAERLENQIEKLDRDLVGETEKNKDDITHFEMLQTHYHAREKAYVDIQSAAAEAVKDLELHERKEVGLQERKKHALAKAKKLKRTLQDDTAAKTKASRTIEESAEKMQREKAKAEEYEASLAQEEKILEEIQESLKDRTQVFHDQIEVKQRELQPWKTRINAKQAEVDVATSERDALAQKAEDLKRQLEEAQQAFETLKADQQAKISEQDALKGQKANLQRELKQAEDRLKKAQERVQQCRQKASSTRQRVDEARASQADTRSQNRVLDGLTRLRNSGRVQGFHGRLGSLGTIPDKYDVAVSTACGSLNHMVVDSVEQAQACIEYLRTQNIGRSSFIVLDKLTNSRGMEPVQTPEGVPRLFDLIKPKDPRFAAAFYKGVSNTLVANDMEQASRIAYGPRRWRVVTLAGDLIDTSGTMSGGGSQPARGGMSSKLPTEAVRPEVLAQYERESEEAARELDRAIQEARDAEVEHIRLAGLGPTFDISYEKLGMEVETNKRRILDSERRVRELKSQSKPDAGDMARIAKLNEEIAATQQELDELQEKAGKVEQAIAELEQRILEIGGSRLLTQRSKVEGIKLHITLANDEITKAEVAMAKAEKDYEKYGAAIRSNQASLDEADAEIEDLVNQLEELKACISAFRAKVDDAQSAADHEKEDLEGLRAQLDEEEEKIQAFRKREAEIKQNLADARREFTENEKKLHHWNDEHDKLALEEIDSDDEDEEDEADEAGEGNPPKDPGEPKVKQEPDAEPLPKPERENAPSQGLHTYSQEELSKFKQREIQAEYELLDEKVKNAKPDLSVLKEYKKREEEFMNRAKDLEEVTGKRDAQKQKYDGLRKQRLDEFMTGFNLISLKLKEMYQMITLGGNAELELVDSMDPFSEGIIFSVMPPKKSWKNISNLSGGEKTLSSLALVFALHVFKPTPLYFMDEIDAALDFRNVSIVANYIKDRTKNAQFIIISLRNDMFELSHRLIGIYKTSNQTRSISIDNHALTTVPRVVNPVPVTPSIAAT